MPRRGVLSASTSVNTQVRVSIYVEGFQANPPQGSNDGRLENMEKMLKAMFEKE